MALSALGKLTLFDESRAFGIFVLDEAHNLRIRNKFHIGATELQIRSAVTLGMTATPVMTSPVVSFDYNARPATTNTVLKDLVNIGRFLGFPKFAEDPEEMENYRRALTRAQRHERAARKSGGGDAKLARSIVKGKGQPITEASEYSEVIRNWMSDKRTYFDGGVIRCTVLLRDNEGEYISGLAPFHEHALELTLTELEQEVQDTLAEEVAEENAGSVKSLSVSALQYTGSRITCVYS